jgi:hypothetical protein
MNVWKKHTPDTGSIARPGVLQPNALPIELRLFPIKRFKKGAGAINGRCRGLAFFSTVYNNLSKLKIKNLCYSAYFHLTHAARVIRGVVVIRVKSTVYVVDKRNQRKFVGYVC